MQVTERTPAKVNLCLLVGPRLEGGSHHELFTIFAPIDLYDTLDFDLEARPAGAAPARLTVDCKAAPGEDNLATRALRALEAETGWVFDGKVVIRKAIPVGAGLGGGSSDAAAALKVGARVLAEAGAPAPAAERVAIIARGLGADVPFFLTATPAIGRGIGEILSPIDLPELSMAIVYFQRQLSTARVYQTFDAVSPGQSRAVFDFRVAQAEKRWGQVRDAAQAARLLENDLEQASFSLFPSLAGDREVLAREGALAALMSGSGPTLFGLCESPERAHDLEEKMAERGFSSKVVTVIG
jgi:4-diphosphocytidyl-2-C-methyl-D-erythritol kinase